MTSAAPLLELWGGVECSVVRIGDDYRNQLVDTGHSARFADLDAMAGLGIKAVRYPILAKATLVPTRLRATLRQPTGRKPSSDFRAS